MNTPLSSFTALVKFQFDRAGLTSEIAAVRRQLQSLTGKTLGVKLQASSVSLKGAKFTYIPKLKLEASTISLRDARYTYKGKLKSKDFPPIKQEVKLHYTGKLTTLPPITQVVNMVYRNRQGSTTTQHTQGGGSGSGGNTNPWHMGTMAGGLGGLITRGNLAAVGAGAFTQQSFTQANFDIAQVPQFEFITGSAEEAAKQVAFLNKEVDRLSLPLRETSNMYRQLLASTKKGLGIEKTQELFSSFSEISAMLGLSDDAQARGLRAFGQMASKGQVYSEELRGQLSEALPNAVGIFAQALYGNDPDGEKKLFKAMERGEVRMEELVKVIDYMKTLSREDLIAKVMDSPARKMTAMRTAWSRLLTEINSSFMLDTFTFVFDTMADGIRDITKWMKENKGTIDSWVSGIKMLGRALMELAPILLTLWGLKKVFSLFGMFTAGSRSMRNLRYLFLGGDLMRLFRFTGGGSTLAASLLGVFKKAFLLVRIALPALIYLLADDIYTALSGGDSLIGRALTADNPFSKWISRTVLGAFKILTAAVVNVIALVDLAFGSGTLSDRWSTFKGVMKENYGDLGEWIKTYFGEVFNSVGDVIVGAFSTAMDYLRYFFNTVGHNLKAVALNVKRAVTGDWKSFETLKDPLSSEGYMEDKRLKNIAANQAFVQGAAPFSAMNPSFMPRSAPTSFAPSISLVINASGTPEDIQKIATQTFIDQTASMLMGAMANTQGGK